jgi:hypothetical protein
VCISLTNKKIKDMKKIEDWTTNDVLYTKGGYGCTIVTFYKVIKRTAKTLTVIRIEKSNIGDNPANCHTVPADGLSACEYATEEVARINKYGNAHIKNDPLSLKFWDGTPVWTDNGFGH